MTQKKTNLLFFLQLVPVPQAKLQILENTTGFRKMLTTKSTFKNQIKVPFYWSPILLTEKCRSTLLRKSHFIEVPFYWICTVVDLDSKIKQITKHESFRFWCAKNVEYNYVGVVISEDYEKTIRNAQTDLNRKITRVVSFRNPFLSLWNWIQT